MAIRIFVHGRGDERVEHVEVDPAQSVSKIAETVPWGSAGVDVSLEDSDAPLNGALTIAAAGISNNAQVHVHRECRDVATTVIYNAEDKTREFLASRRIERVLHWALEAFNIPEQDRTGWHLEYGNPPKVAQPDLHLGDLPITPGCKIELALARDRHVQG